MNTDDTAKTPNLSIQDLPGDDWETRFSKQVARNIAAYKSERKMTTKELAEACNEIYGEPGRVKIATLNGLFVGKRKSIGIGEILVFARALKVTPIMLMVPVINGEVVEILPGHFMSVADAASYITANDRRHLLFPTVAAAGGSFPYDIDPKSLEAFFLIDDHKDKIDKIIHENALWIAYDELPKDSSLEFENFVEAKKRGIQISVGDLAITRMKLERLGIPLPEIHPLIAELFDSAKALAHPVVGISRRELIDRIKGTIVKFQKREEASRR